MNVALRIAGIVVMFYMAATIEQNKEQIIQFIRLWWQLFKTNREIKQIKREIRLREQAARMIPPYQDDMNSRRRTH